ncbi:MAG: transposase, partial [Rhodothermales bacterium]
MPEPEAEDARRLPREIERLKKERSAHVARIKSLLKIEGINIAKVADVDFSQLKSCIAEKLLPNLSSELCGE